MRSILIISILAIMLATPAMAENITGTFSTSGKTTNLLQGHPTGTTGGYNARVNHTYYNFDYAEPINVVYQFEPSTATALQFMDQTGVQSKAPKYPDGTYHSSGSAEVDIYIENVSLGSATFFWSLSEVGTPNGIFDANGELFLIALNYHDDFYENISDYSGVKLLELRDNNNPNWYRWGLDNISVSGGSNVASSAIVTMMETTGPYHSLLAFKYSGGYAGVGSIFYPTHPEHYMYNYYRYSFYNSYDITKESDSPEVRFNIGKEYGGIKYGSRVRIYNTTPNPNFQVFAESGITTEDLEIFQYSGINFKIAVQDLSGVWWNKSFNFSGSVPYQDAVYTLGITPDPAGIGQTLTFRLGSSQGWDRVSTWSLFPDYQDENLFYYCNGYPCNFWKMAGNWMQYDGDEYTISWGSAFPDTVTGVVDRPGTYTFRAHFFEDAGSGDAYDVVTIAGEGAYAPITFRIEEASTGALIKSSMIHINSIGNTTWTNTTVPSGIYNFNAVVSRMYRYLASANGYEDAAVMIDSWKVGETIPIRLYETDPAGAGNITMQVSVIDYNGDSISGAAVKLSDGRTKTTGAGGLVSFTILDGGTYKITASKTGYQSNTYTGVMSSGNRFVTLQLWEEGDTNGDGEINGDDVTTRPTAGGPGGNYTSGELNERASGGLMEIMDGLISYWWVGFLILCYAAVKRA